MLCCVIMHKCTVFTGPLIVICCNVLKLLSFHLDLLSPATLGHRVGAGKSLFQQCHPSCVSWWHREYCFWMSSCRRRMCQSKGAITGILCLTWWCTMWRRKHCATVSVGEVEASPYTLVNQAMTVYQLSAKKGKISSATPVSILIHNIIQA